MLFRAALVLCVIAAVAFGGEPPNLDPPDGMVRVPAGAREPPELAERAAR